MLYLASLHFDSFTLSTVWYKSLILSIVSYQINKKEVFYSSYYSKKLFWESRFPSWLRQRELAASLELISDLNLLIIRMNCIETNFF